MIDRIHHVGIAVRDLDKALEFYRDVLGLHVHAMDTVEDQPLTASSKLPTTAKPKAVMRAGTWSISENERCARCISRSLAGTSSVRLLKAQ